MAQQFQALRCYTCSTFQVHQIKKSIKWACKMCGEKQSIKRNYGTGSAKDCRFHVQKLNALRCELADNSNNTADIKTIEDDNVSINLGAFNEIATPVSKSSKWSEYVQSAEKVEPVINNGDSVFEGAEIVLELPQKKRKTLKSHTYSENKEVQDNKFNNHLNKFNNASSNLKLGPHSKYNGFKETSLRDMKFENKNNKNSTFGNVPAKCLSGENLLGQIDDQSKRDVCSPILLNSFKGETKTASLEPAKVLKNSKWAQYIEDEVIKEATESEEDFNSCNEIVEKEREIFPLYTPKSEISLFSECNDEDLDGILDL